jgi:hypothetical protein
VIMTVVVKPSIIPKMPNAPKESVLVTKRGWVGLEFFCIFLLEH